MRSVNVKDDEWYEDLAGCQYRLIGVTSSHWIGYVLERFVGYPRVLARIAGSHHAIFVHRFFGRYFAFTQHKNFIGIQVVLYQRQPFSSVMARPIFEFNQVLMVEGRQMQRFKRIDEPVEWQGVQIWK